MNYVRPTGNMKKTFDKFEITVTRDEGIFDVSKEEVLDYCLPEETLKSVSGWEDVEDYSWEHTEVRIKVNDEWHSYDFHDYIADTFQCYPIFASIYASEI